MHSKASKEVILPLYGNFSELFMYYLMVNVGNPPLLMTASFDTGSSDFLINDVSCSNCFGGNVSIWYNSSKSSDSQSLKCTDNQVKCSQCLNTTRCGYNVSYGGGMTLDAYAYKDEISFSSQSSILSSVAYFGGIYNVINGDRKQGKFFKKHIQNQKYLRDLNDDYPEGIMGFAYSDLSTLGVKTAFDSIVAQNNDVQNIFSICLRDVGGVLSLGGYGNWSGKNEVMYTPITQKNFFGIFVNDILVEGKSIGVNNNVYNSGSVIVDSGTPFPTLPTVAYPFLKNSFLKICQKTDLVGICRVPANQTLFEQVCFTMTPQQINEFPIITFLLKSNDNVNNTINVNYPPYLYLKQQYFCNYGQVGLGVDQEDGFTIIGASMLQGYTTTFDKANSRIGFSQLEQCS